MHSRDTMAVVVGGLTTAFGVYVWIKAARQPDILGENYPYKQFRRHCIILILVGVSFIICGATDWFPLSFVGNGFVQMMKAIRNLFDR